MHAISKFANIITHGYNVCELKRRKEWFTVNGKYKKSKFTYSVIPLFRYSAIPRNTTSQKQAFKVFKVKLPAFARIRPLLFSRTLLSNLLNKIQFTFEAVPCLILGLFRRFFRRCASILAQCYEGVGGRGGWGGGWGGRRKNLPR